MPQDTPNNNQNGNSIPVIPIRNVTNQQNNQVNNNNSRQNPNQNYNNKPKYFNDLLDAEKTIRLEIEKSLEKLRWANGLDKKIKDLLVCFYNNSNFSELSDLQNTTRNCHDGLELIEKERSNRDEYYQGGVIELIEALFYIQLAFVYMQRRDLEKTRENGAQVERLLRSCITTPFFDDGNLFSANNKLWDSFVGFRDSFSRINTNVQSFSSGNILSQLGGAQSHQPDNNSQQNNSVQNNYNSENSFYENNQNNSQQGAQPNDNNFVDWGDYETDVDQSSNSNLSM